MYFTADDRLMRLSAHWVENAATQAIFAALTAAGQKVYFVGGCVRNGLLGLPVTDIDLATDAVPQTVLSLCQGAGLKGIPTGIDHGTVTVVSQGQPHEITTFRRDIATDGRRAVVAFSNDIVEDARRRDFTMNALYATPQGIVLDPLGGLTDLKARRLRFIEDASRRIQEDFLRSLRFFRFSAMYSDPEVGFDPTALAAIAANLEGLSSLSGERVGSEMKKLLAAPDPAPALAGMRATGVLLKLLPAADDRALAPLVHLEVVQGVRADPIRRLAALTTGQDVIMALRLSKAEARRHAQIGAALGNMQGPAELAYRGGAAFALDVCLLRAALFETHFDATIHTLIARGAAAVFPVKSADLLPFVQGAALGQALRKCEARWIASDFQLTRAALLRSAV